MDAVVDGTLFPLKFLNTKVVVNGGILGAFVQKTILVLEDGGVLSVEPK